MRLKGRRKRISRLFSGGGYRRKREKVRTSIFLFLVSIGFFGVFLIIQVLSPKSHNYFGNDDEKDDDDDVIVYDYQTPNGMEPLPEDISKINQPSTTTGHMVSSDDGSIRKRSTGDDNKIFERIPIQSDWQPVGGSADKFYVYSAYYISGSKNLVKVIGAARTKTTQHTQCRLYDIKGNHYGTIDGRIQTIRENWNLRYSACFVICQLSAEIMRPYYVSIMPTSSPTAPAGNILRVRHAIQEFQSMSPIDFSVCVKPIHFNYNNVLQLVEWIEFHRLMGVEHFTFYNHTMGEKVNCLLNEVYQENVTVLPWTNLPLISQKEIRTEGLFAALNDCVYRHQGASKYLIMVDLDEMIVPRRAGNYPELMEQLRVQSNKKKIGAYSIQNGFFYLQWPNDETNYNISQSLLADRVSHHLLMLRKTRRKSRLHPHKQRSKYICDPEKVIEAGNHFVWEMNTGYNTLSVPAYLASLHHYRLCEFGGNQCIKSPSIVDRSIDPYAQQLVINSANSFEQFGKKCIVDVNKLLKHSRTP